MNNYTKDEVLRWCETYLRVSLPFEEKDDRPIEELSQLASFSLKIRDQNYLEEFLQAAEEEGQPRDLLGNMGDELTSSLLASLWLSQKAEINDSGKASNYILPSIAENDRNKFRSEWTVIVRLCRAALDINCECGRGDIAKILYGRWAALWRQTGFSLFRRLALYAAANYPELSISDAIKLLLDNNAESLWALDCEAEVLQFFRLAGARLEREPVREITDKILEGPRREGELRKLSDEEFSDIYRQLVERRLGKLVQGGVLLKGKAAEIGSSYIKRLPKDDTEGMEYRFGPIEVYSIPPRSAKAILGLPLREKINVIQNLNDSWSGGQMIADLVQQSLDEALELLEECAKDSLFEEQFWSFALSRLAEYETEPERDKAWGLTDRIVREFPDVIGKAAYGLSEALEKWVQPMASSNQQTRFLYWWRSVWKSAISGDDDEIESRDYVQKALNSEGGKLAESLLTLCWSWFGSDQKKSSGIPADLLSSFNGIVEGCTYNHKMGQVILASRSSSLYWLDEQWAKSKLIDNMTWQSEERFYSSNVVGMWQGLLWLSNLTLEFLAALEDRLLEAMSHLDDFGEGNYRSNLVQIFAENLYVRPGSIDNVAVGRVFDALSPQDLDDCLDLFRTRLMQSGDKVDEQWDVAIKPILEKFYPRDRRKVTQQTSEGFIRLALSTHEVFPKVAKWLLRNKLICAADFPHFVLHHILNTAGGEENREESAIYPHLEHHPRELLDLLSVYVTKPGHDREDIAEILTLARKTPKIDDYPSYKKLRKMLD